MTSLTIEKTLKLKKNKFRDLSDLFEYLVNNKIFKDEAVEFQPLDDSELSAEDLRLAAEILNKDNSSLLNLGELYNNAGS